MADYEINYNSVFVEDRETMGGLAMMPPLPFINLSLDQIVDTQAGQRSLADPILPRYFPATVQRPACSRKEIGAAPSRIHLPRNSEEVLE